MNDLEKYFYNNDDGILVHKWLHYFEIYDRHFSRYRNKPVTILEIGVFHGGSIKMWQNYFGDQVSIHAIDINPTCKKLEEENVRIHIGSQEDRKFLRSLKQEIPKIDILIDDGGHTMKQQIATFEELYDHIAEDGVYLCEDLHTSYWRNYGGGYKKKQSFIEYSKNFIDKLNAWHSENKRKLDVDEFTQTTHSVHYYDSVIVLEKRPMLPPEHRKIGKLNPLIDEGLSV